MKESKKKKSLRELWKDKRERAKIELMLYGIFFVGVIIFVRIMAANNSDTLDNNINSNFLYEVNDNYQYIINVNVNDDIVSYKGKVLGNNMTIDKSSDNLNNYYYVSKDKYYVLEDGNYILTTEEEVFDMIEYRYLDIKRIKEYFKLASEKDNTYLVKVSDIVLNSISEDEIILTILPEDKSFTIDYTNLFKTYNEDMKKVVVEFKFFNVGNIISLDE